MTKVSPPSLNHVEQQSGLGCLTLAGIFLFIWWSVEIVLLITHPPIDYISLLIYTLLLSLYLFLASPRGRPLVMRYPTLGKLPLVIAVFFCFFTLLKQYPFNSLQTMLSILIVCLFLFTLTPWSKRILRWFPLILFVSILLVSIFSIYPITMQAHVDYMKLFSTLLIALGLLFILVLFLRLRHKMENTSNIHFDIGKTDLPQGSVAEEKPITDIHFLGVSFRVIRSGKFTKITISSQ